MQHVEQTAHSFPKTKEQLNQLIADISQLAVNIHQTHWYMRGPEFFKLHPLMDEYLDQLGEQLDEVAERLIALGGSPFATLHEFAEHTGLPDEKVDWNELSLVEFIERLVHQYGYLRDEIQAGIDITDNERDFPTQDMLNGFKATTDKNIWMLQAFLGKGPFDK